MIGILHGAGRGSRTPEDISRLIYSQMRLTTSLSQPNFGADRGIRTHDPLFTKQLL